MTNRPLLSLLVIITFAACGSDTGRGSDTTTRDSAGVEIVESIRPAWDEATAWRIPSEPTVQIGVEAGAEEYQLANVRGALRLDNGTIVVMNGGSAELRYYDDSGRHIATGGGRGDGPGELGPGFVEVWPWPGDSVAVWDARNRRLTIFDSTGETDGGQTFRLPANAFPRAVAILEDRKLFGMQPVISSRPPTGPIGQTVRDTLVFAAYPADGQAPQEVARLLTREVWNFRWQGRTMPGYRLPWMSPSYAVHRERFYYTLGELPEIRVFTLNGDLTRIVRQRLHGRPVTDATVETVIELMMQNAPDDADTRREYRAFYYDAPWFEVLPAYRRLLVDRESNLWAKEYAEPGTQMSRWFVFDQQGQWQGTVQFPDRFEPQDIGADYVLGVQQDELDVEYVRMYKLLKPDQQ